MTAQFPDTVEYQDNSYSIAGVQGESLFVPQDYGLEPVAISTACWRGFICQYAVHEDRLSLQSLRIRRRLEEDKALSSRKPPSLFGIEARHDKNLDCLLYNGLRHPVDFSGGLLIGRDFIREFYVHMGFHPAYKFKTVYELLFEEGLLLESRDLSEEMMRYRKQIADQPPKPRIDSQEASKDWVKDCFSLDYTQKPPFNK